MIKKIEQPNKQLSIKTVLSKKKFTELLFTWHNSNPREMPWKQTSDPYSIWVAEIILQQTRVMQGTSYYLNFIQKFPTIIKLANAREDEVLKIWEGLGYYSRARNMHAAAIKICHEHKGKFPESYESILGMKGVGPYSAAAISSFAFDLPHAAVDGNVIRVLARIFGIEESATSSTGKKNFQTKANELIDTKNPGSFNQAMMNFGALQCVPQNPDCKNCCFRKNCFAFQCKRVNELPLKIRKPKSKNRYFIFSVYLSGNKVLIEKRNADDIWKGLYQFPVTETDLKTFKAHQLKYNSKIFSQLLSHQKISSLFNVKKRKIHSLGKWISLSEINNYAFPKLIKDFCSKYLLSNYNH